MDANQWIPRYGKTLLALAVSAIFYAVLLVVVMSVWPASNVIKVVAEIDHPDQFQVYYNNAFREIAFEEKFSRKSDPVPAGRKTDVLIKLGDKPVHRLRLDPGDLPGTARIYHIKVASFLTKSREYGPAEIHRLFRPGNDQVALTLEKDHVAVVSTGEDPSLIAVEPLLPGNRFFPYALTLAFSTALFLFLRRFDYASFPAFYDITRKTPSLGKNITSLDGLRGLATVIIIIDHTLGKVVGIGAIGVWLFMALSGFLLARPFIKNPGNALSLSFLNHFFSRRVRRILPLYFSYLVVTLLLSKRFDEAARHFLFLQGDGVLWVINQEMVFYLMVPFIMAVNYLVFRGRPWLIATGLTLLMLAMNKWFTSDVFTLYGLRNQGLPLFAGIFLAGMISSYLYYGVYERSRFYRERHAQVSSIFAWAGLILLIAFFLGTTGTLWGKEGQGAYYGVIYWRWYGVAAAVFIFLLIGSDNTFLDRMLSIWPLRAVGLVSFSMYVLHPVIIDTIRGAVSHYTGVVTPGIVTFLLTMTLGYLVACVTYTFVERPFTR
ncbi:MAG: acyltransferase family protein [Desulfobulbaceae bacterium]